MEGGDLEFEDVVWTDECTLQLESHRSICFRKKDQPIRYRMRPKHPPKVNVWAGISCRGATQVVIFTDVIELKVPFARSNSYFYSFVPHTTCL